MPLVPNHLGCFLGIRTGAWSIRTTLKPLVAPYYFRATNFSSASWSSLLRSGRVIRTISALIYARIRAAILQRRHAENDNSTVHACQTKKGRSSRKSKLEKSRVVGFENSCIPSEPILFQCTKCSSKICSLILNLRDMDSIPSSFVV